MTNASEFIATTLVLPVTPLVVTWFVLLIQGFKQRVRYLCTSGGVLIYSCVALTGAVWRVRDFLGAYPLVGAVALLLVVLTIVAYTMCLSYQCRREKNTLSASDDLQFSTIIQRTSGVFSACAVGACCGASFAYGG